MANPRFSIRRLETGDVPEVLGVISDCRREYGLANRLVALLEPSDHNLFETYQQRRSTYLVAVVNDEVVGGAGIARLADSGDSTISEMTAAIAFYESHGFQRLSAPLGQTGHSHNDCWMLLSLPDSIHGC